MTYLQEQGFHPVLLKGQGCASYYPNSLLRATGDLDVWVGIKDYERAKQAAIRLCQTEEYEEIPMHLHIMYGKTKLEIHRLADELVHPLHHRYFQKLSVERLAHPQYMEVKGVQIPIPPKDFNALHIFMHLWHHLSTSGIGLRQFVDLAMILHRDHEEVAPSLQERLKNLGKSEEWKIVGGVVVDLLGLPKEEYPLYASGYTEKAKKLLQLTLKEGNFGVKIGRAGGNVSFWSRKFRNLHLWLKRLSSLYGISPKLFYEQFWQIFRHILVGIAQLFNGKK